MQLESNYACCQVNVRLLRDSLSGSDLCCAPVCCVVLRSAQCCVLMRCVVLARRVTLHCIVSCGVVLY